MKTKVYIPIPVSSGELPEREDELHSVDVVGLKDDYPTIVYYRYETKTWSVKIDFWLKKEEVPELTEEEKQQWKQQRISKILEEANGSWKDLVEDGFDLGIEYAKAASKVEVKWEENTK